MGEDEGAELLLRTVSNSREALSNKGVGIKITRRFQMVGRVLVVFTLCDITKELSIQLLSLLISALWVTGIKGPN